MRNRFAQELEKLAVVDPRIIMMTGDLGNTLFTRFQQRFPERFYNCGVAEANMASVAAGLALSGWRPITYSIAPFNTTRCLEQIKVDICYHNAPVIIMGLGAGLAYASLGGTHHSCEDLAILRALPNLAVVCPGDPEELGALMHDALNYEGPVYIRLGKKGEEIIHHTPPHSTIGRATVVRPGKDICLFSTGTLLPLALAVGNQLNIQVVSLHTIKPLDEEFLRQARAQFPFWVSLEEHYLNGGMGSALAEWIVDHQAQTQLLRFGTPDRFHMRVGEQDYVRALCHLTLPEICARIRAKHESRV